MNGLNVQDLLPLLGAAVLNPGPDVDLSREVTGGYACDLLSWVMTHGRTGTAWVTVQTHLNVVAVATLLDFSAVIIPEGIEVPEATIAKAADEGVALLATKKTAYEICGLLCAQGVQPPIA